MTGRIKSIHHAVRRGEYLTDHKLTLAIDRLIPELIDSQDEIQAGYRPIEDLASEQRVNLAIAACS